MCRALPNLMRSCQLLLLLRGENLLKAGENKHVKARPLMRLMRIHALRPCGERKFDQDAETDRCLTVHQAVHQVQT